MPLIDIKITKSKIFFYSCLAFVFGVGIASFLVFFQKLNPIYYFAAGIVLILVAVAASKSILRLLILITAFFIFGIWRQQLSLPDNQLDISRYNNTAVEFIGKIDAEPDIRLNNVKYKLRALTIGQSDKRIKGKVLLNADLFPAYDYGDIIRVKCRLQTPTEFQSFAYDRYLAMAGIYSVCYQPEITLLDIGQGHKIYRYLLNKKYELRTIINSGLAEPHAGFARALMFGDRRGMPSDLEDDFTSTGLTHLVAISGMNITILAALCMNFLIAAGLYRKQAYYFSVILLIMFIFMIGLPASAVRAGIMGILVLTAQQLGRLNRSGNAIALAAVLMLLLNPALLRDDVGFQLSFLAVIGLVALYPRLKSWYEQKNYPALFGLGQALLITMSAIIFTLPIIAFNFSNVSLIAPLANILVGWAMAPIMMIIIFAIVATALFPILAPLWFFPAYVLLQYIIRAAGLLADIPHASLKIDHFSCIWIMIYYFSLLLALRLKR